MPKIDMPPIRKVPIHTQMVDTLSDQSSLSNETQDYLRILTQDSHLNFTHDHKKGSWKSQNINKGDLL